MNVDSAVILAGGLGTRLKSLIQDTPKPMARINGRPFLEYQIDYWLKQGIRHFVISVGYQKEMITRHFGETYKKARIEYAIEESPLGTGGGLLLALDKLKSGTVLVLNGDTFFEISLNELVEFHGNRKSDWTIALSGTDEKRYMGIEINPEGKIVSFNSRKSGLVNAGVYLLNPKLLENWKPGAKVSIEEDMMPALFDKKARFYGLEFKNKFIDIGVPEDYLRSSSFLAKI